MVFERKCYGDLEKITVRKENSFYSNGHYLCKTCDREYRKIDGTNRFVLVRDKVN